MTYYKDLIAERDARKKLANSLIKWWNVSYDYPNAKKTQSYINRANSNPTSPEDDESLKLALEIHQRLENEANIDKAIKQAEIDRALAEENGEQ